MASGDLRQGDMVWLTPRTLGAPAICFGHPQAIFERWDTPYAVVTVDGRRHHVHQDNIQRSAPYRRRLRAVSSTPAELDGQAALC